MWHAERAPGHEVQPVCFDTSELPFVLIVYQICFRPWHRSVTRPRFCVYRLLGRPVHARLADLFVRKVPAHYTSKVSATVVRFCRCETLRPQLCRRDSARYIRMCIYMPHLHFSAIPRRNDYPTRCIAFLSDRYRADSFRSIFYRYFEILEAVAFFPKFDPTHILKF